MKYFIFSVDIEDWFQVENFKESINFKKWDKLEIRFINSTEKILSLFKKYNIKSTFFVLGWIAQRYPDIIKKIKKYGNEIASHGYNHDLLYNLSDDEIENDIVKSIELLSNIAGCSIYGYRAPSFSINDRSMDILKKHKIKYDSSYNKFQINPRYGVINLSLERIKISDIEYTVDIHKNGIVEFPISVNKYFNIFWPLGGGYFRLSPGFFLKKQIDDLYKKYDILNIYLHPWEFDPDQPKVKNVNVAYKFRHYYGLNDSFQKLEDFIKMLLQKNIKILRFIDIYNKIVK